MPSISLDNGRTLIVSSYHRSSDAYLDGIAVVRSADGDEIAHFNIGGRIAAAAGAAAIADFEAAIVPKAVDCAAAYGYRAAA